MPTRTKSPLWDSSGVPANLSYGSGNGSEIYLCLRRGYGAPIADIAVDFDPSAGKSPSATPPAPGFHLVRYTPFGDVAALNGANKAGTRLLLAVRPNVQPLFSRYGHLEDTNPTDQNVCRLLCVLNVLLYAFEEKAVTKTLQVAEKLIQSDLNQRPGQSLPPYVVNHFLKAFCDATPLFATYFTTETHATVIEFLVRAFRVQLRSLEEETALKILDVCFLARHEDKKLKGSRLMLEILMEKIYMCAPCHCQGVLWKQVIYNTNFIPHHPKFTV
eukprot:g9224.t1